jgi:cysteine desulfurase
MGLEAKDAVEHAREQVAKLINAKSDCVFFTNSATEANNIVLNGFNRILTTNAEHSSVLEFCGHRQDSYLLEHYEEGPITVKLRIERDGTLNMTKVRKALCSKPDLASIILANNEIGTIHDIGEIGRLCKLYSVLLHTDATQAVGKIPIDVEAMNVFALTFSGHKIYGPKGVGVLYVRDPERLTPLLYGGFQNTLSSGTQNVPAIVGLGAACDLAAHSFSEQDRIGGLRDYMWDLISVIKDISINGTMTNRLPNNLNVTIPGVPSRILAAGMDDVMISGGAACQSDSPKPSHVIKALRTPHPECAVRISLGRFTTKDEIEYAARRIIETVKAIRSK